MPFNEPGTEESAQPAMATAAAGQDQPAQQFAVYDGSMGSVGKIAFVNALLGLFTLGIYRFWGKTNMRRHLWSRMTLLGDRLEYTGKPIELLLGFLVAAVIMAGLAGALFGLQLLLGTGPGANGTLATVYMIVLYFLSFFAVYRARRYRLLRTQWRGIRFSQTGSARNYALRAIGFLVLTVVTLGLTYPFMQNHLQHYRTNNTWFGDRQLSFDGRASDLFWKWVLALVLAIPTLGISLLWYSVTEFRYFTSRTRFGGLSFSSTLKTMKVFLIYLVFFIVFFILYFLLLGVIGGSIAFTTDFGNMGQSENPFANIPPATTLIIVVASLIIVSLMNVLQFILFLHPMFRAVTETLLVTGTIDLDDIKQSDAERGGRGEGLADVLDVGAI